MRVVGNVGVCIYWCGALDWTGVRRERGYKEIS